MERATIVYNPIARNAPSRQRLQRAADSLAGDGWQIDLRATVAAGHATELAREAATEGARVVFACGGDGTINEVVNGLVGSDCALALIRGGMGDVFAREVGVPRLPEQALRLLLDGEQRRVDLGLAGGRHFLLMAGIGFDGSIVARVPTGPKRLLGSTAYALWGLRELGRYRSRPAQLRLDADDWEGDLFWVLLANTRSYGGVLNITAEALADDGLLDAYVFSGNGLPWVMGTAARLALGRHHGAAGVSFARLRALEVTTPGLPVQADGEYFGETPMSFGIAPLALSVLLPRGRADRLFGPD